MDLLLYILARCKSTLDSTFLRIIRLHPFFLFGEIIPICARLNHIILPLLACTFSFPARRSIKINKYARVTILSIVGDVVVILIIPCSFHQIHNNIVLKIYPN